MSTITKNVYESKWGFHPVSRESCAKLKKAHKLLFRAYKDIRKYARWQAKLNKVGDEPVVPEFLLVHSYHFRKGGYRYGWTMTNDGSGKNRYYEILEMYQNSRRPVSSPELVKNVELPSYLDETIKKLEEFYCQ